MKKISRFLVEFCLIENSRECFQSVENLLLFTEKNWDCEKDNVQKTKLKSNAVFNEKYGKMDTKRFSWIHFQFAISSL